MSRLPILTYGDPCLTRRAAPVGAVDDRVRALAADLVETMYDAPGRGLAAPQVGVGLRMFVIDCHWKDGADRDPLVMIDPEIVQHSDELATREEGCLSIPDLPMAITRPSSVRMRWTAPDGTAQERSFDGIEAVCVQHEYDHLDGILICDRVSAAARAGLEPTLNAMATLGALV